MSWKSESKVLESPGICYAMMWTQTQNNCKKCSNHLFAIFSQRVTVINIYSSMDAANILLNIAGLRQCPCMCLWSWKGLGICDQESGNPDVIKSSWCVQLLALAT